MAVVVEPKHRIKVGTFYLDTEGDIKAYEEIRNNSNCSIIKKETQLCKEKDQTFDEGNLVSSTERTRICWVVEYEEQYLG